MNTYTKSIISLAVLTLVLAIATGCPTTSTGKANLTTVFTTDAGALAKAMLLKAGPVDDQDIESLILTINKITLDKAGADDEGEGEEDEGESEEGEGEGEGEGQPAAKQSNSKIEIFTGPVDIDIMQLDDISEILSTAEIDAGTYTKVRIYIQNPRLVLKADPDTVITDVGLTANSRLFISEKFTLEDGEDSLLILDFQGIHLIEKGNGGFTLTPQLRAEISLTPVASQASGTIQNLDTEANTFDLVLEEGTVPVTYKDASGDVPEDATPVWLAEDVDTPTGTEANLTNGLQVRVSGSLSVGGTVAANMIELL